MSRYKAITKLLGANVGAKRMHLVFDDFTEMFALAFRNGVDLRGREAREERYLQIAGQYSRDQLSRFGEAFGLIVSNPPFVITPRDAAVPEYEYRDGGLVGDALVEAFVREAPGHLVPGGSAQLLGNWESIGSDLGLRRLESWIDPALDAWVVQREALSPLEYAELWIRDGGTTPREAGFEPLLNAWLDDFAARDVTEIGFGYVLLRRPATEAGDALRRFETLVQPVTSPGRAFREGLAGHDALADGIPDVLLVAPDVTEARHHLPGQEAPSVIEVRQGGGFGRTLSVDPALAGFVGACDGELSVSQIVAALADLLEVPMADLWADLEPRIRRLVIDGFLVPAPDGIDPGSMRSHRS